MGLLRGGLSAALAGSALMTISSQRAPAGNTVPGAVVPPGVTAGVAVYDRVTGRFVEKLNEDHQFRSASVVKLLIALDLFWDRGPRYDLPPADRNRLDAMLRSSNDDAANYYWDHRGGGDIVDRMVSRLGLTHTERPPATHPGFWGYVALTAADTVRIYQFLLDQAPGRVRRFIMSRLHQPTRYGSDGFDQYFGIASVFNPEFSIKQGWSGFMGYRPARQQSADLDLDSEALHTTGTVGADDRTIVALYTLHPGGTQYGKAYTDVTRLTRALNVPGGVVTPGSWLTTTGSGVRVRSEPTTSGGILGVLPSGADVLVSCQKRGELIDAPPRSSEWWAYLPKYDGYMTNVYIGASGPKLPGVPVC